MRTREAIYTRHHETLDEFYGNLENCVKLNLFKGKKLYAFGSNNISGMSITFLRTQGVHVDGIIDNSKLKQGRKMLGLKITSPEETLLPFDDDNRILVHSFFIDEMITQLEDFGYRMGKHIIVIMDVKRAKRDYHYLDRTGLEQVDSTEEIKQILLETTKELDKVCTENGIRYYLFAGSLLGAIRHKGFIPWDDDIDLLMPVRDLAKLTEVMQDREDYSMLSIFNRKVDFFDTMAFFTDNRYLCDFAHFPQSTAGCPVDLFPLIGMPKDEAEQEAYLMEIKQTEMEGWMNYNDPAAQRKAADKLIDLMLRYDYETSPLITSPTEGDYMQAPRPAEWFQETVRLPFEDAMLLGPKDYDAELKWKFGNYMELPPKEKRVGGHGHYLYRKG